MNFCIWDSDLMLWKICFRAIEKSNCFHRRGHEASCEVSHKPYMIGLGLFEIVLSQIPNIEQVWWLSIMASIMSFGYSSIGAGLAFAIMLSGNLHFSLHYGQVELRI